MPRATPPAMQPTTVAPNCAAKLAARHAFTPSRPAPPAVRAGSISAAYRAAVHLDQTETPDRARPGEGLGAEGGTRTHTSVTSLRPERSASTYSATSAKPLVSLHPARVWCPELRGHLRHRLQKLAIGLSLAHRLNHALNRFGGTDRRNDPPQHDRLPKHCLAQQQVVTASA